MSIKPNSIKCPVCNSESSCKYHNLNDYIFKSKLVTTLYECRNQNCAHIFAHPYPTNEDLMEAYASYYTHEGKNNRLKKILLLYFEHLKKSYSIFFLNYKSNGGFDYIIRIFDLFLILPFKHYFASSLFYTEYQDNSRVLEVGVGDGTHLFFLKENGWNVYGVDFDQDAVENANKNNLNVSYGTIKEQNFSSNYFDVVVLRHVIEHLPYPDVDLSECYRVLKPGGKLVIITPNSKSIGHFIFNRFWRGLEPPRHLSIFNKASLLILLNRFKLNDISSFSTSNAAFFICSASIRNLICSFWRLKTLFLKPVRFLLSLLFQILSTFFSIFGWGEELVVICKK